MGRVESLSDKALREMIRHQEILLKDMKESEEDAEQIAELEAHLEILKEEKERRGI